MIGHLAAVVVEIARHHRNAAYLLVCLLSASESLPLAGAVVPGTTIIVAIGALVPSGALEPWPLMAAASGGAVLGDGFSYWLGHRYRRAIVARWPFSRYPALIARGEALFARHGGKSVLVSRFMPGVRAVVPLVAGIVGLSAARFYSLDVISALVWGPSHVLGGALAGAVVTVLGAIAGRLAVLALALAVVVVMLGWLTRRLVGALPGLVQRLQAHLIAWATGRRGALARLVLSLVDPQHAEFEALAVLAALLVGALWLFFGIIEDMATGDPLVRADVAMANLLRTLRTGWVDRLAVPVAALGDGPVIAAVAAVCLAWLAGRRAWRAVLYWLVALVLAGIFAGGLKLALHHPAPDVEPFDIAAFSFPSGSVTESAILYGFLALLIGRETGPRPRAAAALAAVLLVAAIALSRLYLGAGRLSAILGGLAFGVAWVAFSGIAYLRHRPASVRPGGLAGVAVLALAAAGTIHVGLVFPGDLRRYAVMLPERTMALADWRRGGWAALPGRRVDLLGGRQAPLTVQWAGSRSALTTMLRPRGWGPPVPWTGRAALAWLAPDPALGDLPVLPRLADGRPEGLVLVAPGPGPRERLVLRLWPAGVILRADGRMAPLWVGTVAAERLANVASLVSIVRTLPDQNAPRDRLAAALTSGTLVRRPDVAPVPGWDGAVLLGIAPGLDPH